MSAIHQPTHVPLKMPAASGSRPPRESTRSSRRRVASTGPPVVLGGGVGVAGSSSGKTDQPVLYNRPALSPALSNHGSSKTASPVSPLFPISAPAQTSRHQHHPVSIPTPVPVMDPGSTNSLSTTASTSSRTLKTPHSKLDHAHPPVAIASSSGSLDGHSSEGSPSPANLQVRQLRLKDAHPRQQSPTPESRKSSSERLRSSIPPPALTLNPLPPTPTDDKATISTPPTAGSAQRKSSTRPLNPARRPPPLEIKTSNNRLSQDWVQINVFDETPPRPARPAPSPELVDPTTSAAPRLPPAKLVPVKSSSPGRPLFERTHTAPPMSPSRQRGASLDQLRSTSPTPQPRQRQNSLSTPPAAVLGAGAPQGPSAGRLHLWKSSAANGKPQIKTRRSVDVLRPSMDALEARKEQQRQLGVASVQEAGASERKSSGLSLKKSSGALKALFQRGASGKGKERAETPPLPVASKGRPSTAPMEDRAPRPSFGHGSVGRKSSDSPSIVMGRVSSDSPRGAPGGRTSMERSPRPSFGNDRSLYPAPPAQRSASQGAHPIMGPFPGQTRTQAAAPPLQAAGPPLRAPSPHSSASSHSNGSQKEEQPLLKDALPASSLPYLVPRASVLLEDVPALQQVAHAQASRDDNRMDNDEEDESPVIKPSKSLHLLSLPDLDLSFDMSFDKIGMSPSTPRRRVSPIKSREAGSPTPARSLTTRLSPRASPSLQRSKTERRRSRSFDGLSPSSSGLFEAIWSFGESASSSSAGAGYMSPDVGKLFAERPAASAPTVSKVLEPSPELQQDSFATASEEERHARTPSNASSTNETASPSPPHTPEQQQGAAARSINGLGVGILEESPSSVSTTTDTPKNPVIALAPAPALGAPFEFTSSGAPPSLPLPALPTPAPPTALTVDLQPIPNPRAHLPTPRTSIPILLSRSTPIRPNPTLTTRHLARDMVQLLYAFRYPTSTSSSSDRANTIRNELLPLLVEVERRTWPSREGDQVGEKQLREACFEWAEMFLVELRVEQAANERGACLEGLAAVVESSCLSEVALRESPKHQDRFTALMVRTMGFVMGKLGAKGVFHNTLLFSGRFLAYAFFRIPHVGEQLVTVLQPPRGALQRFTQAVLYSAEPVPPSAQPQYPDHLLPLCLDTSASAYLSRLHSLSPAFATQAEQEAFLFPPGNWLRRWQSDDSELFPAFYRAYHRHLAHYLSPAIIHYEHLGRPLPASILLRAPGYAHLATIFAKKGWSYIQGSVNAVTTSSSAGAGFDAMEGAAVKASQKPPVLETACRRLVETLSTFAGMRVMVPRAGSGSGSGVMEVDGQQLYASMLDLWTKSLISKTSLYAPKGVFCLFDVLDGIVDPPPINALTGERDLSAPSLLDVPHLIWVVRMILTEGEHALTLVKVIAFVFTHWEVLTARPEDRKELCLGLLLEKPVFERLLLFWSQSVRSYVLRLVVFRLAHLHTKKEDGLAHDVEIESVRLLQTRLDRIKHRHDELEPRHTDAAADQFPTTPVMTPTEGSFPRSRSTITMVADQSPRTVASANKAERLLGLGFGAMDKGGDVEDAGKGKGAKGMSWLKKSFGGGKKRKGSGSAGSTPEIGGTSPALGGLSPALGGSSPSGGVSPVPRSTPQLSKSPNLAPPPPVPQALDSPASLASSGEGSGESLSPTITTRKQKPPTILTHSPPSPGAATAGFAFSFELPTASPRSDTFDPAPASSSPSNPASPAPPSPSTRQQPASPHMSRSFSKRSSLLPPNTARELEREMMASPGAPAQQKKQGADGEGIQDKGYDRRLHAYAIRMLAELEDAQKEYDEWWSDGGVGKMDGAPPRLTVAWPFHEGED